MGLVPDKQAAHQMGKLTNLLAPMLQDHDLLMTHPYEGGHPDHDACAFMAHAAARLGGRKVHRGRVHFLSRRT